MLNPDEKSVKNIHNSFLDIFTVEHAANYFMNQALLRSMLPLSDLNNIYHSHKLFDESIIAFNALIDNYLSTFDKLPCHEKLIDHPWTSIIYDGYDGVTYDFHVYYPIMIPLNNISNSYFELLDGVNYNKSLLREINTAKKIDLDLWHARALIDRAWSLQ